MKEFKYIAEEDGEILRISIRGQLLHENSMDFEEMLAGCLLKNFKVIEIDLTVADFLPSFCFGLLIGFAQNAQERNMSVRLLLKPHHVKLAESIGLGSVMAVQER